MLSTRMLLLIVLAGLLPGTALSQQHCTSVPVPGDPLELATGPIQLLETAEGRAAALKLLDHARNNYRLRSAGRGYELKVSFFVDFSGETQYAGVWDMEETFAPGLGVRWTAKAAAGYATTRIDSGRLHYAEGTEGPIPLVLHEARGTLLGAQPNPDNVDRQWIRTSSASLNGAQLTCVLSTNLTHAPAPEAGRSWVETEECIDPQSGLLRVHSLVPGRYALYDYSDPLDFHGHAFPRKVTISEGGKPVIELRVDSLNDLAAPDPALFVPTEQMKANGPAMTGARKISQWPDPCLVTGSILQPVVVFGLLTPSGQIVDAHSLQPSDPRSEAALKFAAARRFPDLTPPGGTPRQQEVFVIAQFPTGGQ